MWLLQTIKTQDSTKDTNALRGDRTNSVANNSATFLMTNMIPQAPNNNRITWEKLEAYSRSLLSQGNELYIICGVYGQVGTGSKGAASTIGHGVLVPAKTWKIIVCVAGKRSNCNRFKPV